MSEEIKKSGDSTWVLNVAQLARIELTNVEEEKFAGQLSAVLENFELLSNVDTTGVEPTAQVTGLTNVFRADEIKNPSGKESRDDLLSNVPEVENGSIKVPGVFENK
ncbi:MAG: Asp-tRNA(Asn)/Glu-tRNA(Gln) amidotransferase subunit GatC [Candidatus Berkelbacteria bacterium]|nr:Asp-tRNA(Asn)/Glu-tRNA(Gln) amidotransferase subunit GatC [Candidatus Berkelbacteria bacterium]